MAIEVFNRYEKKYVIDSAVFEEIRDKLNDHMNMDKYCKDGAYTICNIYYDTEDNQLIRNSLAKPKYKEKLRLRGYGVPKLDDFVYLEIKKKVNGLGNKRRTRLTLSEGYEFMRTGEKPEFKSYMNGQILNEIEYIVKNHSLAPKLYLAYDRIAYFSKEGHDLRITFDFNIRSRRYDLALEKGDYGAPLISGDAVLMEVKASQSIPVWMSRLLAEYRIYCQSFSKYGKEYQIMLRNNEGRYESECSSQYLAAQEQTPLYQSTMQLQ